MELALTRRLIAGGALLAAVITGWQIAHGSFAVATVATAVMAAWLAGCLTGVPADALACGAALFGYLVGNRGFAQVHPPGIPLFPGELALGLGLAMAAWRTARSKLLPIRRDLLNFALLGWLAIGALRLRLDFPAYGFVGVRDFAMVYYCGFFFLAQDWAGEKRSRKWIEHCLTAGFALVGPVTVAFARWPEFFVEHTTLGGVPLIYVKSDSAGGMMVAGVVWFLERHRRTGRWFWLLFAVLNLLGVVLGNSRAAVAALVVVIGWIAVCRDWRILRPLGGMLVVSFIVLLTISALSPRPWAQTPAFRLYESAASMVDYASTRHYQSPDLEDKPGNNEFRMVWWQAVVSETVARGPWFGLGFGYDLADQFTRVYFPEGSEEFSARSPHNFLLSVFGRMGLAGLFPLLILLGLMARRTWRAGRRAASGESARNFVGWLAAWGIFVSACFGVVLEAPMGAVVFWTILGLAHAASIGGGDLAADPDNEGAIPEKSDPALPTPAPSVSGDVIAS